MKPYISIIVPTTRIGGLDVLFSSLENQTFNDFELVLVDSLYKYRKELVAKQLVQYSFSVKHIPPFDQEFSATEYCRVMNTGLINSKGYLALTLCDYTWLMPNCLQIHANFHQQEKAQENTALISSYNHSILPKLHNDFYLSYAHITDDVVIEKINFDNYNNDLNSHKLDNLMWSIFSDVASAVLSANSHIKKLQGKVYNVGGGYANSVSVKEAVNLIKKILPNITIKYNDGRDHEDLIFITDYSRFNNITNWEPQVNVEEGINKIINWATDNWKQLQDAYVGI